LLASNPTYPPQRRRVYLRRAILATSLVILAVVFRKPLFQGNFGVVDPGRVYRSAQPSASLARTIQHQQLGSIVNLRGGTNADAFYRDEVATANHLGVEFYDLPISASRRPTRRELQQILAILDRCKYPILIHCKWGSDRTGLVCAMYQIDKLGQPPSQALGSFNLAHGHFPIFGPQRLHEPIDEYARWLRDRSLTHDSARFRSWIEREYQSVDPFRGWPTIPSGPRFRVPSAEGP